MQVLFKNPCKIIKIKKKNLAMLKLQWKKKSDRLHFLYTFVLPLKEKLSQMVKAAY